MAQKYNKKHKTQNKLRRINENKHTLITYHKQEKNARERKRSAKKQILQ